MSSKDVAAMNRQIMDKFFEDLLDVIEKDCEKYFIEKMQESVQEVVYDAYEPTYYQRREEDGGLKDPRNYSMKVFLDRNGTVCVFIKNLTRGVGKAYYIDEGIVTGKNFYDWERSKAYKLANSGGFSRDFYTYMEYTVVNDNELKKLINRGMKKRGWEIKS